MQNNSNYRKVRFLKVELIILVARIGECTSKLVPFIVYNVLGKVGNSWLKSIGTYLGVWQWKATVASAMSLSSLLSLLIIGIIIATAYWVVCASPLY